MTINHLIPKMKAVMNENFKKKCDAIREIFAPLSTEEKYRALMDMGQKLPAYPEEYKTCKDLFPEDYEQIYSQKVGNVLKK